MKDAVDEHAVLAIAHHVEERVLEEHLQVLARDKAGVAHVHVDVASAAVAADGDAVLAHHVLELAALQSRDRRALLLGVPLHLRGTGRRRLKRQQRPGVTLRGVRVSHRPRQTANDARADALSPPLPNAAAHTAHARDDARDTRARTHARANGAVLFSAMTARTRFTR